MKNKKLLFNHLVLQYHKSIGRLKRLSERGLNYRRQTILSKRIEKIKQKLLSIKYALTKASAVAGFVSGMAVLQPNEVNAQNFQPAVISPFSITFENFNLRSSPSFVDIDSDGDPDMFLFGNDIENNRFFLYYENVGNSNSPLFASPITNPFSLDGTGLGIGVLAFGDLDNDGDFDLMVNAGSRFQYFENIGTSQLPEFNEPVLNPFSLPSIASLCQDYNDPYGYYEYNGNSFSLGDLDADGDLDILTITLLDSGPHLCFYFENSGGVSTPSYENAIEEELDWPILGHNPCFGDLDMDGDYDLLTGNHFAFMDLWNEQYIIPEYEFYYYPNNGTSNSSNLYNPLENPFGLYIDEGFSNYSAMVNQSMVDLDTDGDLDVMAYVEFSNYSYYNGYYYENDFRLIYYFENGMCDSVITNTVITDNLTLTFEQSDALYQWVDCGNSNVPIEGEINQSYTPIESGSYAVQINLNGCLSTSECIDYTDCNTISDSVIINGNTLTSEQEGASYQWFNCNDLAMIEGETNQTFTPIESGSYAIEITLNNCFITTECVDVTISGINNSSLSNQFSLIPNPTEGKLNVISDKPLQNAFVQIKSITSQIIFEQKNISGANLVFDLSNHANGLYFLEVTENGFTTRLKIIKE